LLVVTEEIVTWPFHRPALQRALPRAMSSPVPFQHTQYSPRPGAPSGVLAIDCTNGRRNRANGVVERHDGNGFGLRVTQSFGNCSRHIRVRQPDPVAAAIATAFDPRTLVETAATFFIASRNAEPSRAAAWTSPTGLCPLGRRRQRGLRRCPQQQLLQHARQYRQRPSREPIVRRLRSSGLNSNHIRSTDPDGDSSSVRKTDCRLAGIDPRAYDL
jgi:hypothetical protein